MSKQMSDYYSLSPQQIIAVFDREIPESHLGRFYRWMDEKRGGAFSKAYGKYMSETILAQTQNNFAKCNLLFLELMKSMLDLTSEYRIEMGLDESKIFIDSLVKREK